MATIINFYQLESDTLTTFSSNRLQIAGKLLGNMKVIAKFRIRLKTAKILAPNGYSFCSPQQIKNIEDQERQKGNFIY